MTETKRPPVLITGGAGYIGSHASLALLDNGWPVVVLDNLSTGFRSAVPDAATFVEGDVADQALVATIIEKHAIGAIMHFAGSLIVPESVEEPLSYYRNNTANSRALIESAVRGKVPHFVFSSTCAVYGVPEHLPISEATPTNPINPYGSSKLMTERMLADVASAHPMNFCALRYFNVAGADPLGRTGQSTLRCTQLIKAAVEAVVGKRSHVVICGNDYDTHDGTGVRDYIHVSDLAAAHVDALGKLFDNPNESYIFNCGYGRGFSVLEVLDSVDRVAGTKIERRYAPRRPGDPPALVASNDVILEALPWRPARDDLDVIVADALAWERHLAARTIS